VYLRNYKRTHNERVAVLAAAVVHRAYNRIALIAMAIWLMLFVGEWIYGLAFGATLVTSYALTTVKEALRRRRTTEVAPQPAEVAV
jgi:hypothetical protein